MPIVLLSILLYPSTDKIDRPVGKPRFERAWGSGSRTTAAPHANPMTTMWQSDTKKFDENPDFTQRSNTREHLYLCEHVLFPIYQEGHQHSFPTSPAGSLRTADDKRKNLSRATTILRMCAPQDQVFRP